MPSDNASETHQDSKTDASPTEGSRPLPDAMHEVMADHHRREMLYYLLEHGDLPVETLGAYLAIRSENRDQEDLLAEIRDIHLPMLVETGLVTKDPERDVVELAFVPEFVLEWIEIEQRVDLSDSQL